MRHTKLEYAPLLGPGYHLLRLYELKALAVDRFEDAERLRRKLFFKLEEFVQELLARKLPCDLWIDGSYLTEEPAPSDIDIAVRVPDDVMTGLDAMHIEFLHWLSLGGEFKYGLDIFAFTGYWIGHPKYGTEEDEGTSKVPRTYCHLYGLNHTNQWLKGIAVIPVWENEVGLRIRSATCR